MERNNSLRNNGKIIKSNKINTSSQSMCFRPKKKIFRIRKEAILSVLCEVLFYVVDVSLSENPGVTCAKNLRKRTRQKSARY
jgi:hypothetical protein